tara:strand:+ start:480 stop:659 length:180 start_codon:yes stop_codon:yes gene_type:complete
MVVRTVLLVIFTSLLHSQVYMSEQSDESEEVPQGAYVFVFLLSFAALIITMFVYPLWTA